MKVKELIDILRRFPPDAPVRVSITWPDRVTETHENLWVGQSEGGPQINAAMDLRGLRVYVGCVLQQRLPEKTSPVQTIDLGQYASVDDAAKVRDFYVVNMEIDEPLNFPGFDYDKWIPPRTMSGEYNEQIAAILKKKLLSD